MQNKRVITGLVLVSLTVSTIVTLFIIGEGPDETLHIVEQKIPSRILDGSMNEFSIAVVARKPIFKLEIEFASLRRMDIDPIRFQSTEMDSLASLTSISKLMNMSTALGVHPNEIVIEEITRNRTTYEMLVLDFTPVLGFLDDSLLSGYFLEGEPRGLTTVYAGLYNESHLCYLYGGSKGFFFGRNTTLNQLNIARNQNTTEYTKPTELSPKELREGFPTILDAPDLGKVKFHELSADEIVRISFSVNKRGIGQPPRVWDEYKDGMELINIWVNSEIRSSIARGFFVK